MRRGKIIFQVQQIRQVWLLVVEGGRRWEINSPCYRDNILIKMERYYGALFTLVRACCITISVV